MTRNEIPNNKQYGEWGGLEAAVEATAERTNLSYIHARSDKHSAQVTIYLTTSSMENGAA